MATVLQQVKTTERQQNQTIKEKHRKEVEFLTMFYEEQNRLNQENWKKRFSEVLNQLADYEEELYEKDQHIQCLKNERGLEVPMSYCSGRCFNVRRKENNLRFLQ